MSFDTEEHAVMNIFYHVVLMRGSKRFRLALASFYFCCIQWAIVFFAFFSIEPATASRMQDIMMRLLPFYGLYLVPVSILMAATWLASLIGNIAQAIRKHKVLWFEWIILSVAPISHWIFDTTYGLFLTGHGTRIHQFLYELPKHL